MKASKKSSLTEANGQGPRSGGGQSPHRWRGSWQSGRQGEARRRGQEVKGRHQGQDKECHEVAAHPQAVRQHRSGRVGR